MWAYPGVVQFDSGRWLGHQAVADHRSPISDAMDARRSGHLRIDWADDRDRAREQRARMADMAAFKRTLRERSVQIPEPLPPPAMTVDREADRLGDLPIKMLRMREGTYGAMRWGHSFLRAIADDDVEMLQSLPYFHRVQLDGRTAPTLHRPTAVVSVVLRDDEQRRIVEAVDGGEYGAPLALGGSGFYTAEGVESEVSRLQSGLQSMIVSSRRYVSPTEHADAMARMRHIAAHNAPATAFRAPIGACAGDTPLMLALRAGAVTCALVLQSSPAIVAPNVGLVNQREAPQHAAINPRYQQLGASAHL